jgi:putative spermidine/putrescine transport system substrate-binding protein
MKRISKLLLAISFVLSITSSAFAVTIASWGGAYTESQKLGYGDPTAKKLGIPVNWVDYTGGLSEIKAQVEAGAITWDIIDVYLLNLISTKTLHLHQMVHQQVKIILQACQVNVL